MLVDLRTGAAEADGVEVLTRPVDVGRLLELVDRHAPTVERTPSAADSFREREIVEAIPHGIVLLDREGCVLDVNAATERILGYGREGAARHPARRSRIPTTTARRSRCSPQCSRGESDGYTIEKRYLRKDGEHVWARLELRFDGATRDGRPRRCAGH